MGVHENDVCTPSARVYKDAPCQNSGYTGRMSALGMFGRRPANVMVVVKGSLSVNCSCESVGSNMGVTGGRLGEKAGGIGRGQARVRIRGMGRGTSRAHPWVLRGCDAGSWRIPDAMTRGERKPPEWRFIVGFFSLSSGHRVRFLRCLLPASCPRLSL